MIKSVSLVFILAILFSGCLSVPESVFVNNMEMKAHNPLSVSCKKPYVFTQDCSGFSGAKRVINIAGFDVKVAGSENGHSVMVMNNNSVLMNTEKMNKISKHIMVMGKDLGLELQTAEVMAMGGEIAGYFFIYDGDIYTYLKTLTVK